MSGDVFIKEEQLIAAKKDCLNAIDELTEQIKSYSDNATEINSVVTKLKEFYDTSGGRIKIQEIEDINILDNSLKNIGDWANGISINYYKKGEIIDMKSDVGFY